MKLGQKIAALIRSRRPRAAIAGDADPTKRREETPSQRPTPIEETSLPLDPAEVWGIRWEPREKLIAHLADFVEQLALESYLNGPGFEFPDQEIESRTLAFLDRLVARGELKRVSEKEIERSAGVHAWVQAQQTRIKRLVEWWRYEGGPDIDARVL
jgi:hypothetical protein